PLSAISKFMLLGSSVIRVSLAVAPPAALGWNTGESMREAPAGTIIGSAGATTVKAAASMPPTLSALMGRAPGPALLRVMGTGAETLPTSTEPKSAGLGMALTLGTLAVPCRLMGSAGFTGSSFTSVMVALRMPIAIGLKVTAMVWVAPGCTLTGKLVGEA